MAYGPDFRWGECKTLTVPPDTRIRIYYTFGGEERMKEIRFPEDERVGTPIHLKRQ
jgi:hypothetical protein